MQREQRIGTTRESAAEIDTGFHGAKRVARRAVCQLPIAFVSEHAFGGQPEVHEAGAAVAPARNKVRRPGAAFAPQSGPAQSIRGRLRGADEFVQTDDKGLPGDAEHVARAIGEADALDPVSP